MVMVKPALACCRGDNDPLGTRLSTKPRHPLTETRDGQGHLVEAHLKHCCQKLGAPSQSEAVAQARAWELLE